MYVLVGVVCILKGMTETDTKKKLVIIDGKSVFYRGYYAMPNLSTKDGRPTGGVFGFATMALEVIKRLKPDYVCVAWDKPKTNIRRRLELYPEYKAGRKPAPPDFYEQIPLLHELLQAFGWPLYEMDDYEADDLMGTLAVQAAKQDIDTLLITSDMDMLQLVDPHIHVFALKKGLSNIELYSPKSFEAKYNIRVDQFVDLKALKGDSSDNIPGVPGIGEKTAIELLRQHETLDGVYENLALLKDSVRKKLEAGKDLAYLSKELAQIWTDAPLKLDLTEVDGSKCNPEQILAVLQRLEFRTLARQLPDIMQVAITDHQQTTGTVDLFAKLAKNVIVDTNGKLLELANDLKGSEQFVLFSRTAGRHGQNPRVLLISPSPGRVFTIKFGAISPQHIREALGTLFEDETIQKIGHDLKSTLQLCYAEGFGVTNIAHDTQIGAFLINPLRREFSLTELAQTELGYEGSPLEEGDDEDIVTRAPEIIAVITKLAERQTEELRALPKVAELAKNIEWPVISVLAEMEFEGIQLDTAYLADMNERVTDMISDLEQQIYGYADTEFNIGSTQQLADVLFNKMAIPSLGIKKGKTGYSTAASELDKLRGVHPIVDLITQWREVTKLKNTYIDTLPKMVDERSRVHTTFNMTVAQTGRLSSNDPNLQNIPVRTELGKHIRTAFVAGPGNVFVSADYSQFELRLAAYLAGDTELIQMFNDGADIHTQTAAQVYGVSPEQITKAQRRDAKVINFGVLYGMSPHGLAIATGMTIAAAKTFIDRYFELRKPLLTYMNSLKEKARKDGYVETLFGRRRPSPDIHSSNFVVRQAAERAAINMPIQGTEADLMKMAMITVQERLKLEVPGAKQLLQIHDSILVECKEADAGKVADLLKTTMEGVYDLPVKLTVDTSTGKNWGEL
jgi:DNA polymerase-1